jgi:hypothetical protein
MTKEAEPGAAGPTADRGVCALTFDSEIMHPQYREWLEFVFAHEVSDPQWYFDIEAPSFVSTEQDVVEMIRETFTRSGEDLKQYSDGQVNQGIWFLASPSGSNSMFSIRDGKVPLSAKVAAIHSIYDLYRGCFAGRCAEVLGHIDEPGGSDLNPICYMFWDVCPISYLDDSKDTGELEDAIFSVLSDTIRIPHRACIEGGLHGLGEVAYRYEAQVRKIIDDFLATAKIDDTLRGYAERAREGAIL